jgi:hypothetical protein
VAPSCRLRLARFSARLKFQDRAECGNNRLHLSSMQEEDVNVAGMEVDKTVNREQRIAEAA